MVPDYSSFNGPHEFFEYSLNYSLKDEGLEKWPEVAKCDVEKLGACVPLIFWKVLSSLVGLLVLKRFQAPTKQGRS